MKKKKNKFKEIGNEEGETELKKEAVEKMFPGTKVKSVNTVNYDGKKKRVGMSMGRTAKTKKAVVQLTEDSKDIDIVEGL